MGQYYSALCWQLGSCHSGRTAVWNLHGSSTCSTSSRCCAPRTLATTTTLCGPYLGHWGVNATWATSTPSWIAVCVASVWTAVHHLVSGGTFIMERPAMPTQEDYASVWRTALVRLLLRHPDFHLHTVEQWRWGSTAVKPIFVQQMYASSVPEAVRPTTEIIGKNASGEFRTNSAVRWHIQLGITCCLPYALAKFVLCHVQMEPCLAGSRKPLLNRNRFMRVRIFSPTIKALNLLFLAHAIIRELLRGNKGMNPLPPVKVKVKVNQN